MASTVTKYLVNSISQVKQLAAGKWPDTDKEEMALLFQSRQRL